MHPWAPRDTSNKKETTENLFSYLKQIADTSPQPAALASLSTMEIAGQNRQHGSMIFDNIYYRSFPHLRPVRNATTISLPDQIAFIPTSSPLPVCYSNTGYDDVIGLLQDVPYTPFRQNLAYTKVSQMSGSTPSSHGPVSYASIHPYQSQKTHRSSHSWVPASELKHPRSTTNLTLSSRDTRIGSYLPAKLTATLTEELNASRGLLALSQDMTPRNIYGPCGARKAADLYSPSVDNVESFVEDLNSTTSEFYVSPQPNSLLPLASKGSSIPQCMMNQFSLKRSFKRSFKSEKTHKCKICHKQFRRPSSLQMHNYSHNGEKRE